MLVEVIGKPLRYGKMRQINQVGAQIEMTDQHARLFLALGRVKLPDAYIPAGEEVPIGPMDRGYNLPSLDDLPKPKRKYKRRDMQAE